MSPQVELLPETVLRKECNINLVRADQTLEAILARSEEARPLNLEMPAALMLRLRVTYTSRDDPIEYVEGLYRGDRYKFDITLYIVKRPAEKLGLKAVG